MSALNLKIIVGSTRPNRFSEKAAAWIGGLAKQRPEFDTEQLDLRDYPLPFFEEALPPLAAKDSYDHPVVASWREKIREADGFIVCTPEYNHGYSAVLKNAFDYTYAPWGRKPAAFVAWGNAGGTRAVEQLRQVLVELDMVPLRWSVHIANPWTIPDAASLATDQNNRAAHAMLDHLAWWTKALKASR